MSTNLYYNRHIYKLGTNHFTVMTNNEAKAIWERYLHGDASEGEKELIESWYNDFANKQSISADEIDWNSIESQFDGHLPLSSSKKVNKNDVWRYTAAAAAVLILGILCLQTYLSRIPVNQQLAHNIDTDVAPGGNKATLILSDGTEVSLANDKEELRVHSSQLTYEDGAPLLASTHHIKTATLSTPRGGQYRIVLPDGTKVWLNAESSLTYPIQFDSKERQVSLEGEAYFEVAHQYNADKKRIPFTVNSLNQDVHVLGTSFNISAYKGESIKTTLLTGIVEVSLRNTIKKQLLKPNQQITVSDENIELINVDPSQITLWKDGVFNLSGLELKDIMNQISRWYNIDVIYQSESLKRLGFEGNVPRFENLKVLLAIIEKAGDVSFEIKNNIVYIKRK